MSARYVGLISGTSVDGVDAALVEIDPDGSQRLLATHVEPPPDTLRAELLHLAAANEAISVRRFGLLDRQIGAWFAAAANALLASAAMPPDAVAAIGSHGQTLYHEADSAEPFTLQLGDPNLIAARTGIRTVADFRRADMAVGGQGAPLVPAFHRAAFGSPDEQRCVVNIGGMANVTVLPAGDDAARVLGFDTGPGNAMLDDWIASHKDETQDTDGRWAASGAADPDLLARMQAHAYFQRPPPKSTGRETFNLQWVRERLTGMANAPAPESVQRTLLELSAVTIADAIETHAPDTNRVLLCGGGSHNSLLRQRLTALLAPRPVVTTADYGIGVDWVEAAAFAWLAERALARQPGNLPSVTGAERAVILGGIYAP